MKIQTLKSLTAHIAAGNLAAAVACIDTILEPEPGTDWHKYLRRLQAFMIDGRPRFTIIKEDGNSKLPFTCFSSLPGADFCPGAGDCLEYCYSFKAWRYPAAYCRQAQNSILMTTGSGRAHILADLDQYSDCHFRLYVDGDFGSVDQVAFWMGALIARPTLKAYGYSKSFTELLAYSGPWPDNYRLNLSGGHNHEGAVLASIERLPITRDWFLALPVPVKVKSSDHGTRAMNAHIRAAAKARGIDKVFPCPGKCGSCTRSTHACGSMRFKGIPIAIAVH